MFDAIVPATELQNLPDYTFYLRTILNGRPLEPLVVKAFPPYAPTGVEAEQIDIIRISAQRYGVARNAVKQRLEQILA